MTLFNIKKRYRPNNRLINQIIMSSDHSDIIIDKFSGFEKFREIHRIEGILKKRKK